MLQGQAHYGRHRAQCDDGTVALGRNLFPTLPEDHFDNGPQSRSHYRLVADVRLDNRAELVARLGLGDHGRLADSALLFEALIKWGEAALNHFVGEFAFAFWDGVNRKLLLGRDILGLRPLCFHRGKDFFAFASMPSGLHALNEVPYDFDPQFMVETLALIPHVGSKTVFKDVERVEPAHWVRVTCDDLRTRKYWQAPGPTGPAPRPAEYEEGLRSVVDEAVAAQLRGAGNVVASHLSGGLDSSTVTATVARLLPEGQIIAFTAVPRAGFQGGTPPGTIANEAHLAAATAALYPNIEHVLVESSGESPLAGLDRSFFYEQQPSANLSNSVWGRSINRIAQERGASVLFKGALGNLTTSFAGLELLPYLLSQGRLLKLARHLFELARNAGAPPWVLIPPTFGPYIPPAIWQAYCRLRGRSVGPMSYSAASVAERAELERKSVARGFDLAGRPRRDPREARIWAFSQADGGNSYKSILAQHALSIRDPTADKRVIEFTLATPYEEFVRGGVPRALARRAFSDRLPHQVTSFRMRGYQAADWHEGLDRARAEVEAEVGSIARCAGAWETLDINWLKDAVESWPDGGWDRSAVRDRYRLGLLRGISAGHFMRKVRGTN